MARIVALGEIMARFSVRGGIRLKDAATLDVCYGGAEANVAVSLANFGHDAGLATRVPENPLGDAAVAHLLRYGVDTTQVLRGGERLGIYYMEMGAANRGSIAVYDRAGSSFATMEACPWDLDGLFHNADLFHITGICPAVAPAWRGLALELVQAAHARGVAVSYDVNFRRKLWSWDECMDAFGTVLPYLSILSASWGDAQSVLGLARTPWSEGSMRDSYDALAAAYPNLRAIYATHRVAHSSSANDLIGYLYLPCHEGAGGRLLSSKTYAISPVVDRVGAGDAFAAGILHGLLENMEEQQTVDFAAAASALKHSVLGDANVFSADEVGAFMEADADIRR